ncbi:site-specific integrase [Pseudoclavibacter sp. VKM Ac-2888]|uniref:site-specific integrase n=1 Tax=Pseudoclavibacter sp. VKM Ac-2888 TaxID=2783830 RepID=UPI00188BFFA4|nr:site-specific integrase [Pseudoclavibacter sp. VKM Ac-2888]MBF4549499.1 site-specific integrase [Pseudoclavibacter sp. VKM Ac-2888]
MIKKRPNGRFQARVFHAGREVASKTFDLKKDALSWEDEQQRKLLANEWVDPQAGKAPLGTVLDRYVEQMRGVINPHTWDTDEANYRNHVPAQLRKWPISAVTAGQLDNLYADKIKAGLARGTVSRLRDSLSSAFTWAKRQGIIGTNPVLESRLPADSGSEVEDARAIPSEVLKGILEALRAMESHYVDAIEFLALTGIRWGELKDLRVGSLSDLPYPRLGVVSSESDGYERKSTKSRKRRFVPLVPRAIELFHRNARGKSAEDRAFTSPRGGNLNGGNLKRETIWATTGRGYRIHDLRHTAATNWLNDGVDVATVSAWLGHSSAAVTLRIYSHYLSASNDQAALAKIAAANAARAEEAEVISLQTPPEMLGNA